MTNPLLHAEQLILSEFLQSGLASARPAATGSHKYYFETDNNALYQDQGTWVAIAVPAPSGVDSVTGDGVDNTDPANPVLTFPTPAEIGAATSAQGALADTALQPADVGSAAYANTGDFDAAGSATTAEANAKSYADGLVVGLWDDRGAFDASGGAYPSTGGSGPAGAIRKGDIWTISVAGTLPTGQVVEIGDVVRALIDVPGNTQANWAIQQNNIGYTAENSANKSTDVETDKTSNVKYPSVKAVYDWAIGLFTASRIGSLIHGTSAKTVLVDADEFALADSGAAFALVKTTWANIKSKLKTYFDGYYLLKDGSNDPITGGISITPATGEIPLDLQNPASGYSYIQRWKNHLGTVVADISEDGSVTSASGMNAPLFNGGSLSGNNSGDVAVGIYGDGSDGDVTFDGLNAYSFAVFNGTETYTLTRDVYARSLTNAGMIVCTAGYRIFATVEINNFGTIHNDGSPASGTTAGAGGLGGFFKAGGTGATGLLAASAGAVGVAPPAPSANTLVGGVGGRGANAFASVSTFKGTSATITSLFPNSSIGGYKITSMISAYLLSWLPSGAAANWQMTPSMGGGSGAKSTTGTTGTSGGGGGGGGIVFLSSPHIYGGGLISANGGTGGDAGGTVLNSGGGGGGGGGLVVIVSKKFSEDGTPPQALGGAGGASNPSGTTPNKVVAVSISSVTSATNPTIITPTLVPSKQTFLLFAIHCQGTAGNVPHVQAITGFGMLFNALGGTTYIDFNSAGSPIRSLELWVGRVFTDNPTMYNIMENYFTIYTDINPVNMRVNIDQIQGLDPAEGGWNPQYGGNAVNGSVDSGTSLTLVLPDVPQGANAMTYAVFARSGGTVPVAGAGMTLLNNQTVAPILVSEVGYNKQNPSMSHTTAAAIAGVCLELITPGAMQNGISGDDGKVILLSV